MTKENGVVRFGRPDDPRGTVTGALGGSRRLGSRKPHLQEVGGK